ncbi:hypothetical protein D3C85_1909610 [compost metagenome]
MAVAHPGALQLIVVHIALHAVRHQRVVDKPGQVAGGEPGLIVQQHGAQQALVADEQGGC